MKNSKISVGVDIGSTKIAVAVGRRDANGEVEIIGVGESPSLGVTKGIITNISETIKSIRAAVEMAQNAAGVKIKDVSVGIAGQHLRSERQTDYITREDRDKVIEQEDIDKLVERVYNAPMQSGEKIIHVLPLEYKIDSVSGVTQPIGMSGSRIEASFLVVVGQVSSISNIARCVRDAGLNLIDIKLEPLAAADAILTDEEKEAGVILMDIGGGTTDIAVFCDNIIRHTSVIPYGGNIITGDIKEACSILQKYAEKLKVDFGSTWPGENKDTEIVTIPVLKGMAPKEISLKSLSKIIHARMNEILNEVNNEISNYRKIEPNKKLIGGIVLTGGVAELRHLPQLVTFKTSMHTRIGYPNIYLSNMNEELNDPSLATCLGLVISGLKDIDQIDEEEEEAMEAAQAAAAQAEKATILAEQAQAEQLLQQQNEEEQDDDQQEEEERKPKRKLKFENLLNDFLKNLE